MEAHHDHDWHTAVHEAGHAVADLVLEHGCAIVSIVPDFERGTSGRARQLYGDDLTQDGMEKLVISLYAGAEAQRLAAPADENWAQLIREGASSDDAAAEEYLRHCQRSAAELREAASLLVREHWALVELVARELTTYRVLHGDEIEILLEVHNGDATHAELQRFRTGIAAETLAGLPGRSRIA